MEAQELLGKYLSGNASQEEVILVNEWVEASEGNRKEFLETKEAWVLSNIDRFDDDIAWKKVKSKITTESITVEEENHEKSNNSTFNYFRVAASLTIIVVSAFLLYNFLLRDDVNSSNISSNSIVSEVNKDVVLTDGSRLYLSKDGLLTYESDFNNDQERKVKLIGKAFFDISKNEKKPFVIETNNARILVTGTSFLVNEKNGYTEVIVKSGSVKLTKFNLNTSITLKKGERGIVSNENRGLIKQKNRDVNFLSWMTGSFNFVRTPLKKVVELLEDKYEVPIVLKNKEIGNCKLNSEFIDRPLDEIMDIIGVALNLNISHENGEYLIDGNNRCR